MQYPRIQLHTLKNSKKKKVFRVLSKKQQSYFDKREKY